MTAPQFIEARHNPAAALRQAADEIAAWNSQGGWIAQADVEVFLTDRADEIEMRGEQ